MLVLRVARQPGHSYMPRTKDNNTSDEQKKTAAAGNSKQSVHVMYLSACSISSRAENLASLHEPGG